MRSTSNPDISLSKISTRSFAKPLPKLSSRPGPHKCVSATKVSEKGDAGLGKFEVQRETLSRPQSTFARRQRSAPVLSVVGKPNQPTNRSFLKIDSKGRDELSESSPQSPKRVISPAPIKGVGSVSLESTLSDAPICEGLKKDPKLRALCISLGINQSPDTLIGPIEKGQLIIGTLQDTLKDLIKFKIKSAEKKGEKFHIQRSGLENAVRALENAERSLKTIKESKQPVLGRARFQQSAESSNQKTSDAVIRILSNTKEKFDRMENGLSNLMRSVSFVSFISAQSSKYGTPTRKTTSATTLLGASTSTSRRTTALSGLLTLPATPSNTASCSRARTSASLASIGSRTGNKGNPISVM